MGSDRADHMVLGGWVPGVSERLQRSGIGRPDHDIGSPPADSDAQRNSQPRAGVEADTGDAVEPHGWSSAEPAGPHPTSSLHDPRDRGNPRAAQRSRDEGTGRPQVRAHGHELRVSRRPVAVGPDEQARVDPHDRPDRGSSTQGFPGSEDVVENDIDSDNELDTYNEDDTYNEEDTYNENDGDHEQRMDDDNREPLLPNSSRAFRARRIGRSWGRFAELWVPEPLRDARVDPGRRGAIVLLLVATLAAVVTAFGVWRDRPEPRPVESSAIAALAVSAEPSVIGSSAGSLPPVDGTPAGSAPAQQLSSDGSASAAPTTEIVVSVTGLVDKPGIVTITVGARVADAIAAAGGAVEGADLTGLNLAARLADGDSVVVGSSANSGDAQSGVSRAGDNGGATTESGAGSAGGLVDLNTADEAALDTLPGVGPVMAQNILAWRETNGKFSSVEQLQEISGIGPSRYAQLSPLVTVS